MTPEEKIVRAEHAQELLKNPLLKKAFKAVRDEILSQWESASPPDIDAREYFWKMYQCANAFEGVLLGYIQTGEVAKKQLQEKKTLTQKVRSVF